jgi:HSP20 family protein
MEDPMPNRSWFPTWSDRNRNVEPFQGFRTQLDNLFEDWFGRTMGGTLAPRIDASETDTEVLLTVELPGVEEKDIDVSLTGDQLTIKGEKRSEHEVKSDEEGRVMRRVERSYGALQRTMTLPYQVEPERVSATFKNGVLKLVLPKPAEALKRAETRKIQVNRTTI